MLKHFPNIKVTKSDIGHNHIFTVEGYIRRRKLHIPQPITDLILFRYAKPMIVSIEFEQKRCYILYCSITDEWQSVSNKIQQKLNLANTDWILKYGQTLTHYLGPNNWYKQKLYEEVWYQLVSLSEVEVDKNLPLKCECINKWEQYNTMQLQYGLQYVMIAINEQEKEQQSVDDLITFLCTICKMKGNDLKMNKAEWAQLLYENVNIKYNAAIKILEGMKNYDVKKIPTTYLDLDLPFILQMAIRGQQKCCSSVKLNPFSVKEAQVLKAMQFKRYTEIVEKRKQFVSLLKNECNIAKGPAIKLRHSIMKHVKNSLSKYFEYKSNDVDQVSTTMPQNKGEMTDERSGVINDILYTDYNQFIHSQLRANDKKESYEDVKEEHASEPTEHRIERLQDTSVRDLIVDRRLIDLHDNEFYYIVEQALNAINLENKGKFKLIDCDDIINYMKQIKLNGEKFSSSFGCKSFHGLIGSKLKKGTIDRLYRYLTTCNIERILSTMSKRCQSEMMMLKSFNDITPTPFALLFSIYSAKLVSKVVGFHEMDLAKQCDYLQADRINTKSERKILVKDLIDKESINELSQKAYIRIHLKYILAVYFMETEKLKTTQNISSWSNHEVILSFISHLIETSGLDQTENKKNISHPKIWEFVDYLRKYCKDTKYDGKQLLIMMNNDNITKGFGLQMMKTVCSKYQLKSGPFSKAKKQFHVWATKIHQQSKGIGIV